MTSQTNQSPSAVLRQRAERAIKLAAQSQWDDAARENLQIIQMYPAEDNGIDLIRKNRPEQFRHYLDAHNRLGKAFTELGRYGDARSVYGKTLRWDGNNAIAKKNLQRLEALGEAAPGPIEGRQKVDPDLFIEETGKTGVANLVQPDGAVLQHMQAGDSVELRRQGNALTVASLAGEYLGMLETRLALRLTRLMESGNEYAAAIAAVSPGGDKARVIIKETRQSPENVGRLSFPATEQGVRAYTKDSMLRSLLEEDELDDTEGDGDGEWEGDTETESGPEVRFSEYERTAEADSGDDDFEE